MEVPGSKATSTFPSALRPGQAKGNDMVFSHGAFTHNVSTGRGKGVSAGGPNFAQVICERSLTGWMMS